MVEFKGSNGWFGNHCIAELAQRYGTPFFLFDAAALRSNYDRFRRAFSSRYPRTRIYYSVKTNCELGILSLLRQFGSGAEVACGHELRLVQEAGFLPDQVVVDKPCLTDREIEAFIRYGVQSINADSFQQMKRISALAAQLGRKARVSIRVNLRLKGILRGPAEVYIGKFGVRPSEVIDCLRFASQQPHLEIVGLSTHIGSQILSPAVYARAAAGMVRLAQQLQEEGIRIEEINLGGGFPSASLYRMTALRFILSRLGWRLKETIPPIDSFAAAITKTMLEEGSSLQSMPSLAFEPGRSIASTMGIAVSRVMALKTPWIFLDISTTSLPESLFFAERALLRATRIPGALCRRYHVAGATLNSADILGTHVRLQELSVGDLVVVQDAGAYTISRASRFTNLNPPVYLIEENGQIRQIRRGETDEDILGPMQASCPPKTLE